MLSLEPLDNPAGLCLSVFGWARLQRAKGAIKIHLILGHDGYLPQYAFITEGKVADVKVAQQLDFAPGTIIVDDRSYPDYSLWGRWCSQQVFFVTRMKDHALYETIGDREVPQHRHVLKDEQIGLRGPKAIEKCPYPLRRIEVQDPETGQLLVLITNHSTLGASTIAAIYKDHWQIKIFSPPESDPPL